MLENCQAALLTVVERPPLVVGGPHEIEAPLVAPDVPAAPEAPDALDAAPVV